MAKNDKMTKKSDSDLLANQTSAFPAELAVFQTEAGDLSASELVDAGFSVNFTLGLKSGMRVEGVYVGPGSEITMKKKQYNEETKQMEPIVIKTHKVQSLDGSITLTLLGCYDLDKELPTYPVGTHVLIRHNGQLDLAGGFRKNDIVIYRGSQRPDIAKKFLPARAE